MSQSQLTTPAKGVCANSNSNGDTCEGTNMTALNKDSLTERKLKLTPMEFRVTQERQTERPFSNKYNKHWETGSYNCIVCDTELFRSETKFESKSGWPAFSNVVDAKRVKLTPDLSHVGANLLLLVAKPDLARTEVSCANCNAHLGHLFKDGPKPTGLRYCINSSSLIFISSDPNLESESQSQPQSNVVGKQDDGKTVDKVDTVAAKTPTSTTTTTSNSNSCERPKTLMRTSCPISSSGQNSGKICFFQSASGNRPLGTSTTTPHRLIVNSMSSGSLATRSRWLNNDHNNKDSIVRRRISLFSSSTPIETISSPPKMIILRETSL